MRTRTRAAAAGGLVGCATMPQQMRRKWAYSIDLNRCKCMHAWCRACVWACRAACQACPPVARDGKRASGWSRVRQRLLCPSIACCPGWPIKEVAASACCGAAWHAAIDVLRSLLINRTTRLRRHAAAVAAAARRGALLMRGWGRRHLLSRGSRGGCHGHAACPARRVPARRGHLCSSAREGTFRLGAPLPSAARLIACSPAHAACWPTLSASAPSWRRQCQEACALPSPPRAARERAADADTRHPSASAPGRPRLCALAQVTLARRTAPLPTTLPRRAMHSDHPKRLRSASVRRARDRVPPARAAHVAPTHPRAHIRCRAACVLTPAPAPRTRAADIGTSTCTVAALINGQCEVRAVQAARGLPRHARKKGPDAGARALPLTDAPAARAPADGRAPRGNALSTCAPPLAAPQVIGTWPAACCSARSWGAPRLSGWRRVLSCMRARLSR
jgi:hypothetical protein